MASGKQITEGKEQTDVAGDQEEQLDPLHLALAQAAEEDAKEQTKKEKKLKGGKKDLLQVRDSQTGLITFKFEGGGEIPAELAGKYTSPKLAEIAKDRYLTNRQVKNG